MKKLFLIVGIVSLIACALSLLFSAFNWFGYHHMMDGAADLYSRLRQRMNISFIIGLVFAVIGIICIVCCSPKKYSVDYGDNKVLLEEAKDFYKVGENVTFYFSGIIIDTDAEYIFYLDDEKLNADYDERKGLAIKFTMPEHDVKFRIEIRNKDDSSLQMSCPACHEFMTMASQVCPICGFDILNEIESSGEL